MINPYKNNFLPLTIILNVLFTNSIKILDGLDYPFLLLVI